MRKFFSKIHLWLSVPFGIIISLVALSGASLVFESEVTEAMNPHLYRIEVAENAERLAPSVIIEKLSGQIPDSLQVLSIQFSSEKDAACIVGFKNAGRKTLSVNPYTGEVNGWIEGNRFFQTMRRLHRWLLDAPAAKGEMSVGKMLVGISTIVMIVILVSGLFIWIPRSRKALKNRLSVSCTKGWRRFWYDSHVALGFYSTLFLLVMALTGLTWSFGWYRTAAYSLFGGEVKTEQSHNTGSLQKETKQERPRKSIKPDYKVWDNVMQELEERYSSYGYIKVENGTVLINKTKGHGMRKSDNVVFDTLTGNINNIVLYEEVPVSRKLKGFFYSFHTGSWGGVWTKVLYFIAALIGGVLPLSGYYLWIKRKAKKRLGGK